MHLILPRPLPPGKASGCIPAQAMEDVVRLIAERTRENTNGRTTFHLALRLERTAEENALIARYGAHELSTALESPAHAQAVLDGVFTWRFATPDEAYDLEHGVHQACESMAIRFEVSENYGGREVYDF